MYRLTSVLIALLMVVRVAAEDLKVEASVVSRGILDEEREIEVKGYRVTIPGRPCWLIRAEVRNQSAVPVDISYMSCSWSESWVIEPRDLFHTAFWDCAGNFPTANSIPAGGKVVFEFPIAPASSASAVAESRVRLGFIWRKMERSERQGGIPIPKLGSPIATIWSEELLLPKVVDGIFRSIGKIEELPNKSTEATAGKPPPSNQSQAPAVPHL
jgi:hypothetical protein